MRTSRCWSGRCACSASGSRPCRRPSARARGSARCSKPSRGCASPVIPSSWTGYGATSVSGGSSSATKATGRCWTDSTCTLLPGSRSRSSARPARGRARSRACWPGSTTPTRAPCSSTATTSASCGWPTCVARSRSCSRRRSCSRTPCGRTSASPGRTPVTKTSSAPPRSPGRRSSSPICPRATRPCSESEGSRCPADSDSESRSHERSSPIRRCSSSTTRPPPSRTSTAGSARIARHRPPTRDDRPCGSRRRSGGGQDRRRGHARRAPAALSSLSRAAGTGERGLVERASPRAVWRHTRGLLRPVRALYIGAGVAVTLSTLITLAGPALVRYAVDAGIKKHATHPLNVAALVFLGLALFKPAVVRAQILLAATAGERFLHNLRVAAFDKLQALPLSFYEQERASVLLSPKLAAISLVALPILIASSWSFHHSAGRAYHAIRDRVAETLTALQEGLAGVRVVQAFRREKRTLDRYRPRSQAQVHAWRRASFVNIRLFAFLPLAQASALIVVLLAAATLYRHGSISIGTITAFVLYLIQLFDPIGRFTEWLGEFRQGLRRSQRSRACWRCRLRSRRSRARSSSPARACSRCAASRSGTASGRSSAT